MTIHDSIVQVSKGIPISCTREFYPELRKQLKEYSDNQIKDDNFFYGHLAIEEIKRLDKKFTLGESYEWKTTR